MSINLIRRVAVASLLATSLPMSAYAASIVFATGTPTGDIGLNWSLAAGSYWVALEAGSASFLQAPTGAVPAASAVAYFDGSGLNYKPTGVSDSFGVSISAVPKPTTLVLALGGLALVGMARRRS